MSGHFVKSKRFFVGVTLGLAVAAAGALLTIGPAGRAPASVSNKAEFTSPVLFRHTEKIRGPLTASIELVGAAPEKEGDAFTLRGFISSPRDLQNVEFKWAIPSGLELVNGTANGVISVLKAGVASEIQITLRARGDENEQVHLIASGAEQGFRFADSAQFNTLLQPVLDSSREELKKSTEKAAADDSSDRQRTHGLKVFH